MAGDDTRNASSTPRWISRIRQGVALISLMIQLFQSPCSSADVAPPDTPTIDIMQLINYSNQAFVGTIESMEYVRYIPSGPCAEGITPGRVLETRIRTTRVLHGSNIQSLETVRWDFNSDDAKLHVGDKVVAFGDRVCADDWRIWASVCPIDENGRIAGRVWLQDAIKAWTEKRGSPPTVTALDQHAHMTDEFIPDHPFRRPRGMHLVRVDGIAFMGKGNLTVKCTSLETVAGNGAQPPTVLHVRPPLAITSYVGVGDTLLVPFGAAERGNARTVLTSLDYMRVVSGFLPGLGVKLGNVMDHFERTPEGFALKSPQGLDK